MRGREGRGRRRRRRREWIDRGCKERDVEGISFVRVISGRRSGRGRGTEVGERRKEVGE